MEEWKDILGWENYYQVSNMGNIRSKPRLGRTSLGTREYGGKLLKPLRTKPGYLVVNLTRRNPYVRQQVLVHRAVLQAFVGICPKDYQGCHNNGNRADARLQNLRWDSVAGNHADKNAHGTQTRGEAHHTTKHKEAQIVECLDLLKKKVSCTEIERITGVSYDTIIDLKRKRSWRHLYEIQS